MAPAIPTIAVLEVHVSQILIERKQRPAWPWVLLALLVLAAIAWFLIGRDRAERGATGDVAPAPVADTTTAVTVQAAPDGTAAVDDYLQWVTAGAGRQIPPADVRARTAEGLRKLADAAGAMTGADSLGGQPLAPRLDALRTQAAAIEQGNAPSQTVREAFVEGATILQQLRRSSYPAADAQVRVARDAAMAVQADRPLDQQADAVQRFFGRAGDALQAMLDQGAS